MDDGGAPPRLGAKEININKTYIDHQQDAIETSDTLCNRPRRSTQKAKNGNHLLGKFLAQDFSKREDQNRKISVAGIALDDLLGSTTDREKRIVRLHFSSRSARRHWAPRAVAIFDPMHARG